METTKNNLPPYAKQFFGKLGRYLDTKIYFYGSIQRDDYFPMSSDIDVDIFTDNELSTITKLQNFLGVKRYEFKKIVYRLHKTNQVVYGKKVTYNDRDNNFSTEISIYEEKYKSAVLQEHNSKMILPFHISILLILLKFFYYNLGIITKDYYYYFKKLFMNYMVEGRDVEFVAPDLPISK